MTGGTDPHGRVSIVIAGEEHTIDRDLLLRAFPRAVLAVDRHGQVIAWNAQAEDLLGWSAGDAIGRRFFDLVGVAGHEVAANDLVRDALGGHGWSGDAVIVRKDGTKVWTATDLGPLYDQAGKIVGVLGAADDVTDLRHLERRADDLDDRLRMALSVGGIGTWQWDAATGATTWDETMERFWGLAPGTFPGTDDAWAAMIHPDDVRGAMAVIEYAFSVGADYEVEHRVVWPNGNVRWIQGRGRVTFDEGGAATGTVGFVIDVTDAKEAEQRRIDDAERAMAAERHERERIEFLATVDAAAIQATDHQDLMDRWAAHAVPRLGDACWLLYAPPGSPRHEVRTANLDPATEHAAETMHLEYPHDPDATYGVAAVIRDGRTELIPDLAAMLDDEHLDPSQVERLRFAKETLGITSVLTVPLVARRGTVGAVQFASIDRAHAYRSDDIALAEAAASRIAATLENMWLTDQQRDVAATLQAGLLPRSIPAIPGATVSVGHWAASVVATVGGDFYDVFQPGPDRWALAIGDVCGKGPEAAAVIAVARHTLRAAAVHGANPAEVLRWVNQALLDADTDGRFCTLAYSTLERLDDDTWCYTSVAGGHPLPVAVAGGAARELGAHGTLLGVLPDLDLHVDEALLHPGDTVVLYTDGVNDLKPPDNLEIAAVLDLFREAATASTDADATLRAIHEAVTATRHSADQRDDIALIVLRIDDAPTVA